MRRHGDPSRFLSPERYHKEPPLETLLRYGVRPGDRALDLGCGPGFFSEALLEAVSPGGSVTVLDADPDMLERLRERLPAGVDITMLRAEIPPILLDDGSFDFVWAANVLHETAPLSETVREVWRILAPAGRFVAVDWAPVPTKGGPSLVRRIPAERVADEFRRAGFSRVVFGAHGEGKYFVRGVKLSESRGRP